MMLFVAQIRLHRPVRYRRAVENRDEEAVSTGNDPVSGL
jgi:hypothetical protein